MRTLFHFPPEMTPFRLFQKMFLDLEFHYFFFLPSEKFLLIPFSKFYLFLTFLDIYTFVTKM